MSRKGEKTKLLKHTYDLITSPEVRENCITNLTRYSDKRKKSQFISLFSNQLKLQVEKQISVDISNQN
jgi:hypothetical protein